MMRRLRKFILVTGTLLSMLIAAAFVVSARWIVEFQGTRTRGPALLLSGGSVTFVADEQPYVDLVYVGTNIYGLSNWNSWRAPWWEPWGTRWVSIIEVPLYAVFATVTAPTLLVWRFWPNPPKPGHCKCAYDLKGNTSGVCPECGVEVQA